MSDYSSSGFDSFLSRSIDDIPQANLDSEGPQTTQIRYDSAGITGAIGDTFKMGGVELNGKDNTIVLNDATLHVNDSSTGTSVQASSGNITYFDGQGNLVVQEGTLPRGATGIRIIDKNGLGVAQFGRNSDGTTILKIAKDGFDAATATNDQLVFNSAQDIFKIVQSGSVSSTLSSLGANSVQTVSIPHLLGFIPGFMCFVTMPSGAPSNYSPTGLVALPTLWINQDATGYGALLLWVASRADSSNLYIDIVNPSTATITGPHIFTFKYYILQETAT